MTNRQQYKSIYWAWKSMKQRCFNPKCSAYRNYGARGIGVCKDWMTFEPFLEWALDNGWQPGLDLDRKDNEQGYSPSNCRWTSRRENINNRRCSTILEVNGKSLSRTEWEDALNLPKGIVKSWVTTRGKEYAISRIKEVISCGYKEKDYSRNHTFKKVKCLETGKVYASFHQAAKSLGLNHGNISRVVQKGGSAGGYHFELA